MEPIIADAIIGAMKNPLRYGRMYRSATIQGILRLSPQNDKLIYTLSYSKLILSVFSLVLASCSANKSTLTTSDWAKTISGVSRETSLACSTDDVGNITIAGSAGDSLRINGKFITYSKYGYLFVSGFDRKGNLQYSYIDTDSFENDLRITSRGTNCIAIASKQDERHHTDGWCGTPPRDLRPIERQYIRSFITGFSQDSTFFQFRTYGNGSVYINSANILDNGKFVLIGRADKGAIIWKDSLDHSVGNFIATLNRKGEIEKFIEFDACPDKFNFGSATEVYPTKYGYAFMCEHTPPSTEKDEHPRSWYSINGSDSSGKYLWDNNLNIEEADRGYLRTDCSGNLWLCAQVRGKMSFNGKDVPAPFPPSDTLRTMFFKFDRHGNISKQFEFHGPIFRRIIDDFVVADDTLAYFKIVEENFPSYEDGEFEYHFDSIYAKDTAYLKGYDPKYEKMNKYHFSLQDHETRIYKLKNFSEITDRYIISTDPETMKVMPDGSLILTGTYNLEFFVNTGPHLGRSNGPEKFVVRLAP